jgi:dihydroorotate dehydrogenase electron transfer subunit
MRYFDARVTRTQDLGAGYFALVLDGCGALTRSIPGQFVMVRGDWERDPLLPRAFSLLRVHPDGRAEILARVVGRGTALLARVQPGARISVLGPLGRPFPDPSADRTDLLVAGGVGMPPILMQAEHASSVGFGARTEILYGGRGSADLLLLDDMRALPGVGLHLATEDGSVGTPGRVTEVLEARMRAHREAGRGASLRIMACGPNPMLWAVGRLAAAHDVPAYLSLEEVMACGIGVCLGCAIPARSRPFRYVCKDGPVFEASDVLDVRPGDPPAAACLPAETAKP